MNLRVKRGSLVAAIVAVVLTILTLIGALGEDAQVSVEYPAYPAPGESHLAEYGEQSLDPGEEALRFLGASAAGARSSRSTAADPRADYTRYVRNQSGRGGARPCYIVLHTTEGPDRRGLTDLKGLGAWFDNPSASVSSHVANDAEGNDARYVADSRKAWTQAYYNPTSLSLEQIGYARFSRSDWLRRDKQLRNTAAWIAYWSRTYHVPLVFRTRPGKCGVIYHSAFGARGGGHHDPGRGYPIDKVMAYAKGGTMGRKERVWRRSLRIAEAKKAAYGRSHRIVHAKLRDRCPAGRGDTRGCRILRSRNHSVHFRIEFYERRERKLRRLIAREVAART